MSVSVGNKWLPFFTHGTAYGLQNCYPTKKYATLNDDMIRVSSLFNMESPAGNVVHGNAAEKVAEPLGIQSS